MAGRNLGAWCLSRGQTCVDESGHVTGTLFTICRPPSPAHSEKSLTCKAAQDCQGSSRLRSNQSLLTTLHHCMCACPFHISHTLCFSRWFPMPQSQRDDIALVFCAIQSLGKVNNTELTRVLPETSSPFLTCFNSL